MNPITTYDFTLDGSYEVEDIKTHLKEIARKWAFQKEQGEETGYVHYQGRLILKERERKSTLWVRWDAAEMGSVQLSPTSNANTGNMFYVMKQETRILGPWKDDDIIIPQRFLTIEWRPWQQQVMDKVGDGRKVGCIVDNMGSIGKSTVVEYMCRTGRATKIPSTIDKASDMMAWVMSFKEKEMYFVDIPRALTGRSLKELFGAIEEIVGGYAYDIRYHGREKWFDVKPYIWVFTNTMPDKSLLTNNRWEIYGVDGANNLYLLD